jgi:hypothetical protein
MRHAILPSVLLALAACAAPAVDDTSDSSDALQRFESPDPAPTKIPPQASCKRDDSWVKFGSRKLAVTRCLATRDTDGRVTIDVSLEEGGGILLQGIDPARSYPQWVGPTSDERELPTLRAWVPTTTRTEEYGLGLGAWHSLDKGPTSRGHALTAGSASLIGAGRIQLVSYSLAF